MTKKTFKPNARWMSLGASPSAPDFCNIDVDYVAVGGPGIELRAPDVYLIAERSEIFKWYDRTLEMQRLGGHLVITSFINNYLKTQNDEIGTHLTPWPKHISMDLFPDPANFPCDEIVEVNPHCRKSWDDYKTWSPGELCMATCGTMGLLYAIRAKASEIHMVGLEGYAGKSDYFDNRRFHSNSKVAQHFHRFTKPFINKIVEKCPDIKFFHYGEPQFELPYSNLEVVPSVPKNKLIPISA